VKGSAGTLAIILGLSLGVWMFFFYLSPGAPLNGAETSVVVGACASVVLFGRWIWGRFHKASKGNEQAP
jgi:hypothetical protein